MTKAIKKDAVQRGAEAEKEAAQQPEAVREMPERARAAIERGLDPVPYGGWRA